MLLTAGKGRNDSAALESFLPRIYRVLGQRKPYLKRMTQEERSKIKITDWSFVKNTEGLAAMLKNEFANIAVGSRLMPINTMQVCAQGIFEITGDKSYDDAVSRYKDLAKVVNETTKGKEKFQEMDPKEKARYKTPLDLQRNARQLYWMAEQTGTDPPEGTQALKAFRMLWMQAPVYATLTEGRLGVLRPQNFYSARVLGPKEKEGGSNENWVKVTPTSVKFHWTKYKGTRKFRGDVDAARVVWEFKSTDQHTDHKKMVQLWNDSLKAFPRKWAMTDLKGGALITEEEEDLSGSEDEAAPRRTSRKKNNNTFASRLVITGWVLDGKDCPLDKRPTADNIRSAFTTLFYWNGGDGSRGARTVIEQEQWAHNSMSGKEVLETNYNKAGEKWLLELMKKFESTRVRELADWTITKGMQQTAEDELVDILMSFQDRVKEPTEGEQQVYEIPQGLPFIPEFDMTEYMRKYRKGLIPGLPDSAETFRRAQAAYRARNSGWTLSRRAELYRLNKDKDKEDRPKPQEAVVKKYHLKYDKDSKTYY